MTDPDTISTGYFLGTDRHGNRYYDEAHYAIQYKADGTRVGYLCDIGAWERTYRKIIVKGRT